MQLLARQCSLVVSVVNVRVRVRVEVGVVGIVGEVGLVDCCIVVALNLISHNSSSFGHV